MDKSKTNKPNLAKLKTNLRQSKCQHLITKDTLYLERGRKAGSKMIIQFGVLEQVCNDCGNIDSAIVSGGITDLVEL